jgi:hypothetical protein
MIVPIGAGEVAEDDSAGGTPSEGWVLLPERVGRQWVPERNDVIDEPDE